MQLIKSNTYKWLFLLVLVEILFRPNASFAYRINSDGAVVCTSAADVVNPVLGVTGTGLKCLEGGFYNVVRATIIFSGLALLVVLLIGGMKYVTAGGDEKAIASARKTITLALTGFILVIVSYFLMRTLSDILGVDILQFEVPRPT